MHFGTMPANSEVTGTSYTVGQNDSFVAVYSRVYGRSGSDFWVGSNPIDIATGSCGFLCDAPHQWIVQQQVNHVSCVCKLWRGYGVCPLPGAWHCRVAALWSIPLLHDMNWYVSAMFSPNKHSTAIPHILNPRSKSQAYQIHTNF